MKVVSFVGSKRKKGNTSIITNFVCDVINKDINITTEIVYLSDYVFDGCKGCDGCHDSTNCVVNDDMQILYKKMHDADALILASPTYYYNVSADMKKFIDRFFCLNIFDENDRSNWTSLYHQQGGKIAATISVCEQHDKESLGFTTKAMTLPLQDIGCEVVHSLEVFGAFKKGDVLLNEDAFFAARECANSILKGLGIS